MTSADPRPRRGDAGFTLVELLLAFAILAIAMAYMTQAQTAAIQKGGKARDLRDIRVMSDTVFRKKIYEIWQSQDGDSGTADAWYGDFARLKGSQRDQWRAFRLVFHKQKRMAAGNDPTGKIETIETTDSSYGSSGSSGSGTSGTGTSGSGTSGSGTSGSGTSTDPNASAGEPVWIVWLDVYTTEDQEEPDITLRTIVPVSEVEREQDK